MTAKYKVQDNNTIEVVVVDDEGNHKSFAPFGRNKEESDADFVARVLAGGISLDSNVKGLESEITGQGGTLL